MRTLRRNDHSPRVEMMPLIDVIFLLLTFFMYSMLVMDYSQVLPVSLVGVGTGRRPANPVIESVTIDRAGDYFVNRERVDRAQLVTYLDHLAADPAKPMLYLSIEAQGDVDRGPLFISLLERVREAGITNFAIVGPPTKRDEP
jgi:biopolymer transport protein ExbD